MAINPLSNILIDPVRNFKFLVSFIPKAAPGATTAAPIGGNFATMGFVSLSGLSVATESIAYREGGYNTNVHQIPGQTSFTPITLSKGVILGQSDAATWMKRLFSVLEPSLTTNVGTEFRCDLDIQVLSHPNPQASKVAGDTVGTDNQAAVTTPGDQHTSLRFKVYNAWITSLAYSNLDAGGNTLMVEEMTLVHEGFDVAYAKDYTASPKYSDFAS